MKHAIRIFCTGVLALLFAIPLSAGHKHFKVSVYVRAYEVEQMADSEWLESTWKTISSQLDVDKIYLETHRDLHLVDDATLEKVKAFFLGQGIEVAGGTTEVALISLNGIVYAESVRIGGDAMDDNIIQYMRRMHRLMIGDRTAEEIKITIGSAYPMKQELEKTVKGRDAVDGMPKSIPINSTEIREALRESVSQILIAVRNCFEKSPAELSGDLVRNGLVLSGGGSLLMGLDTLLAEETNMPVFRAENALTAVADGTGKVINNIERYVDFGSRRR